MENDLMVRQVCKIPYKRPKPVCGMEHPLENMKVYKGVQDNLCSLNSRPDHKNQIKQCLEVKSKAMSRGQEQA